MMENGAPAAPEISDTQRIQEAINYKNAGNQMFKVNNLRQAIGKYHRALLQLKGIGESKQGILVYFGGKSSDGNNISAEMKNQISGLQLDCYNNLAASISKQNSPNYDKIIEYCNKVLDLEPMNEKALYRKATALNTMRRFDETVKLLENAVKDIKILRKPLALAREGQTLQGEKLKKNLQGMYDSKN